jgi:hypothetical protein
VKIFDPVNLIDSNYRRDRMKIFDLVDTFIYLII